MAGGHGPSTNYKGVTLHHPKRWHALTGKGMCAIMWFWVLYRAKKDGPVVLGWRHPWEGHDDHSHGHGHEHEDGKEDMQSLRTWGDVIYCDFNAHTLCTEEDMRGFNCHSIACCCARKNVQPCTGRAGHAADGRHHTQKRTRSAFSVEGVMQLPTHEN